MIESSTGSAVAATRGLLELAVEADQVAQRGVGECVDIARPLGLPEFVQGAGAIIAAFGLAEQATAGAAEVLDCVDDLEEVDFIGVASEAKTATAALAGFEDIHAHQILEDFAEVMVRKLGAGGEGADEDELIALVAGEDRKCAKGVFAGLGEQCADPRKWNINWG